MFLPSTFAFLLDSFKSNIDKLAGTIFGIVVAVSIMVCYNIIKYSTSPRGLPIDSSRNFSDISRDFSRDFTNFVDTRTPPRGRSSEFFHSMNSPSPMDPAIIQGLTSQLQTSARSPYETAAEKRLRSCITVESNDLATLFTTFTELKATLLMPGTYYLNPALKPLLTIMLQLPIPIDEYFGVETGPNQPFYLALQNIVYPYNFSVVAAVRSLSMPKSISINQTKTLLYVSKCMTIVREAPNHEKSPGQVAILIAKGLQPDALRDTILETHVEIVSSTQPFEFLCRLINDVFLDLSNNTSTTLKLNLLASTPIDHIKLKTTLPDIDVSTASVQISTDIPANRNTSSAPPDKSKPSVATYTCPNCKISGVHSLKNCPDPCQFHAHTGRTPCGLKSGQCFFARNHKQQANYSLTTSTSKSFHTENIFPRVDSIKTAALKILIDSGTSHLLVSNPLLVDKFIPQSTGTISLADDSVIPAVSCTVGNVSGFYSHNLVNTLLPINVLTSGYNGILVDNKVVLIEKSPAVSNILTDILATVDKLDSTIISNRDTDGMYYLTSDQLRKICTSYSIPTAPNSSFLHANKTNFYSSKVAPIVDQLMFIHESLGHPNKQQMLQMAKDGFHKNFPLTESQIKTHFDSFYCEPCKIATMSRKSLPHMSSTVYPIGICSIDIKVPGDRFGLDFSSHRYVLLGKALGSEYCFCYLLFSLKQIVDYLEILYLEYQSNNHVLSTVRFDLQFHTNSVKDWARKRQVSIQLPAPYEHGQNGDAECSVKHTSELVAKQLLTSQVNINYWGFGFLYATFCRNCFPMSSNSSISRREAWGLPPIDYAKTPFLPFGARVLAHIPLELQDGLSRASPMIYLGPAPGIKEGILLRNIETGRTIYRRTFSLPPRIPTISSIPNTINQISLKSSETDEDFDDNYNILRNDPTHIGQQYAADDVEPETKHSYIVLGSKDVKKSQRLYFTKINMQFIDSGTDEKFKIVGIYLNTTLQGKPGGSSPMYRFYDVKKYPGGPQHIWQFEHQVCANLLNDPDNLWDIVANRSQIQSQCDAFTYFFDNALTIAEYDEDLLEALHHQVESFLQTDFDESIIPNIASARTNFQDIPPPRNIAGAHSHFESEGYLKSLFTELEGLKKRGATECPADIDIKDIPPELILQMIPIFSKKYTGIDFTKFKCRIVIDGSKFQNSDGAETYSGMLSVDTLKILLAVAATQDLEIDSMDLKQAYLTTTVNKKRVKRHPSDPDQIDNTYFARRPKGLTDKDMPYIVQPTTFIYGHPLAGHELSLKK